LEGDDGRDKEKLEEIKQKLDRIDGKLKLLWKA
jgi:hypothetical protein